MSASASAQPEGEAVVLEGDRPEPFGAGQHANQEEEQRDRHAGPLRRPAEHHAYAEQERRRW